jgi:hypothetical protein
MGHSVVSNIEQLHCDCGAIVLAGRQTKGSFMVTSQPTVQGGRPIGVRERRAFGVEDRPPCPSCGAEMHLFRRSPEPGDHGYEVQIFSCIKCDAEITRSADRKGKPHVQTALETPPRSIARDGE